MPVSQRVAILIETDDSWGRRVVASIAAFARTAGWQLLIAPRDDQQRLRLPRRWQGDGVFVSLRDRSMAEHVRRFGIPAVDVSIMMPQAKWLGRVATNDHKRAQMAFQHFRERGLESFACYAPMLGRYSNRRAHAFRNVVEKAAFQCSVLEEADGSKGWEIDHDHVVSWLAKLPKPLAVFAADAYPARQLAEICEWNELRVPDHIAILAGDDDELLCRLALPELSSIQLGCATIGLEACRMLSRLMKGGDIPQTPKWVAPLYVQERQSTNLQSVADLELAEILRYIVACAEDEISVAQIIDEFSVSRRWLEQRFRKVLDCSPAEYIRRIRLNHAKRLVCETDMTITQIAVRLGFANGAGLAQKFRRQFGASPSSLRVPGTGNVDF